jgi:hypothetical protein
VVYQTDVDTLKKIPGLIRQIIEDQDPVRFDRSHFQGYGEFSLNFETVYYVLSPDYNRYMDIRQAINLAIFRQFERLNIAFTSVLVLQSRILQHGQQMGQAVSTGRFGPIDIRVELQAYVVFVACPLHGRENRWKVDGAQAGDKVIVLAGGGDVFDVYVADPGEQLFECASRVFAGAVEMADIEVDAHGRRLNLGHEGLDLGGALHEQVRLGFDEQLHPQFLCFGDDLSIP